MTVTLQFFLSLYTYCHSLSIAVMDMITGQAGVVSSEHVA